MSEWKVLSVAGRNKAGQKLVEVQCSCGEVRVITGDNLKRGTSKSCGHDRYTNKQSRVRDGKPSRTYTTWQSMKTRCLNPKASDYGRYGGIGVAVCEDWMLFENFFKDMGERPEGMTIDRIDPYGNYSKGNCRWATYKEQRANQRPHKRSVK